MTPAARLLPIKRGEECEGIGFEGESRGIDEGGSQGKRILRSKDVGEGVLRSRQEELQGVILAPDGETNRAVRKFYLSDSHVVFFRCSCLLRRRAAIRCCISSGGGLKMQACSGEG